MISRVTLTLVAVLGLVAAPAAADGPDPADKARADRHFAAGKRLFKSKSFAEAAREFEAAYDIAPHPAVLVNIALSHDEADNLTEAAAWYERYLAAPVDKLDNKKISARQAELRAILGRFRVTCGAENCVVWVGGVERGPAPLELFVTAGSHRVEAVVDGQVAVVSMQKAVSGETVSVNLEAKKSGPMVLYAKPEQYSETDQSPSPSGSEPMDDRRALGPGFWVSSGVTLAAGVVTTVFGVRTLKEEEEFESSGYTDAEAKDTGERDKLITNVFVGVTAAAGATALAFALYDLVFAPAGGGGAPEPGADGGTASVSLVPGPGLGLGLSASF